MSWKNIRRGLLSTLVLAVVSFPAVTEAGLRASRGEGWAPASRIEEREGAFARLWKGLLSLFEKEGASIDPNGRPTTNSGASVDPGSAPGAGSGSNGG